MSTSTEPFPKTSFAYLAKAESRHWWFRARNNILIWVLRNKVRNFTSFLEVGCGTGFVISGISKAFPSAKLAASEYYEDGLAFARQRVPSCQFWQLDATTMTETEAYDCIGSFDVIEHIEDDERVLSNLFRALKSGGHLLLTIPQHPWLWSGSDDFAHHVRRYSGSEIQRKLITAGFKVQYLTSFVSFLLPLMALQRLVASRQDYDLDAEFQISVPANAALYLVMRFEFLLLRTGLRFPAGGSLLLLARKP